jgi:lipopolysaccharide transport system ATP-binding protein
MSDVAIHVDHCWKKFRKGEFHDSLRELIPAVAKRLIGRGKKNAGDLQDREFWALKDVNFEVKKGESLGIIGPNGAGKSTMLKMLSRIIKPNRGSYKVTGRLSSLIEVGAGFHPDLTGRENIYLNGTILGMSRKEIKSKEEEIVDFAGVESFIETPVKRYSSGMMARLGFAVAAHLEPDVLLVDEVLSVGDARFRTKCLTHMRSLLKSNVTVVFISHILEQVRVLCPNSIVLDQGSVVYQGDTDGAIEKYLDVLDGVSNDIEEQADAEVRNMRFLNHHDEEILTWPVREPAIIEMVYIVRRKIDTPSIIINISSLGGTYLGSLNSLFDGVSLPDEPGEYRVRAVYDPMPLNNGVYSLVSKVHEFEDQRHCVWAARDARRVTVEGAHYSGTTLFIEGQWDIQKTQPALDVVDVASAAKKLA